MKYIIPGKFNPPHFGHAITIMRLIQDLEDVTICVTTDTPDNAKFTPEEIVENMSGLGVPVVMFEGVLTEQKINPYPDYTIVSGNPKVIDWAKGVGANYLFRERFGTISGTRIRNENC